MNNNELNNLINNDNELEHKKLSRKRLFTTFLIVDVILLAYLLYIVIFFFINLGK